MFARDQMQLHVCLWSIWRLFARKKHVYAWSKQCLLVIMSRPLVAHQDLWAWLFPCSMTRWLTTNARRVCRNARSVLTCMHACMDASDVVLQVHMDGWMLYTGVGSTLWAWYACMVEAGTPVCMYVCIYVCMYVCMYAVSYTHLTLPTNREV